MKPPFADRIDSCATAGVLDELPEAVRVGLGSSESFRTRGR